MSIPSNQPFHASNGYCINLAKLSLSNPTLTALRHPRYARPPSTASIPVLFAVKRPTKVIRSSQPELATAAGVSSSGGGGVSLEASVRLAGVGVSVIDACPRELLYLTVGDIALEYLQEGQV